MATDTIHLATATDDPGGVSLLKVETRFAPDEPRNWSERLNHWFDELVEQSGLNATPAVALSGVVAFAGIVGGAMFVLLEHAIAAAFGFVVGLGVAFLILRGMREWRYRQIARQLPDAVDLMTRSVRAGRSLEQSIDEMSRELAMPLGGEFGRVARRLELGLPIAAAVRELPRRVPLAAVQIFATALAIHQQTGGNLVHALEQLSQTIRERAEFRGKFLAATAGSRFSIVFLLLIGPIILLLQSLRDPAWLRTLVTAPVGQIILFTAVSLQLVGSLWVLGIFRSSVHETQL